MPLKNFFSFLLLVLAALLLSARDARACSCGPRPTVLDSYERSEVVVIARAVSLEKAEKGKDEREGAGRVVSTRMVVEKVFKGNLKPGDGKISNTEPFRTFYYPNVFEREKASVFTIGPGDRVEGLNIYVPQMEETVRLEGVLLYSDGKPLVDEGVHFEPEKGRENLEGMARDKTDAQGRFSITLLKGTKGILYGMTYTFSGEFENCPKLESLVKKEGRTFAEIRTPVIEVRGDLDLQDMVLKFPFPSCKKARRTEN